MTVASREAFYVRVQKLLRGRLRKSARKIVGRLEKPLYTQGILSARRSWLPDFFCIGAMKAGTTWLYENLRCHPDIYLPDRKEDYFFSYEFYNQSLRHYSRRFAQGAGRVKGEVTPGYGILGIDRIRFIFRLLSAQQHALQDGHCDQLYANKPQRLPFSSCCG